jgi:glycerol-3-phosphate cytidylyltransferase
MPIKKNRIGFVASSFDLLHTGHLLMLEEAKGQCSTLIAGLNVNPSNKQCIESVFERYIRLKSVKFVDEIIPYENEGDLINLLKSIKPDVRFLGEDYIGKNYTGSDLKIPITYTKRRHNFSSSGLIKRIKGEE